MSTNEVQKISKLHSAGFSCIASGRKLLSSINVTLLLEFNVRRSNPTLNRVAATMEYKFTAIP